MAFISVSNKGREATWALRSASFCSGSLTLRLDVAERCFLLNEAGWTLIRHIPSGQLETICICSVTARSKCHTAALPSQESDVSLQFKVCCWSGPHRSSAWSPCSVLTAACGLCGCFTRWRLRTRGSFLWWRTYWLIFENVDADDNALAFSVETVDDCGLRGGCGMLS